MKVQAQRYWPNLNEEVKFDTVNISVKNTSQKTSDETSISTFVMSGPQGDKILEHVHVIFLLIQWSGWRDMEKPCEKD